MIEINCAHCGKQRLRNAGEVNRNRRAGKPCYCSRGCVNAARTARLEAQPWPICNVEGCEAAVRSRQSDLCEMHYGRMRRRGTLGLRELPQFTDHSAGYKKLLAPDHPLSTPGQCPRILEHRAVFYEHYGEGPFTCHFCGVERDWVDTQVARLDDDKENNHIDNLVASCHSCHAKRWHNKSVLERTRRHSPYITWRGKTQTLYDWSKALGFRNYVLSRRLKAGWSVDRAFTERVK